MPADEKNRFEFLTVETVAACQDLELVAHRIVEGFLSGLHRSPYHGFNVEFSEYRPYAPGDPLKFVDWGVYARTDRFLVRESQEETNCRATILLDASASLGFGEGAQSKFAYARCLAGAIAYLMCRQKDAQGLVAFSNGVGRFLPSRLGEGALRETLRALEDLRPAGPTDFAGLLNFADEIPRRGLVILISDLYGEPRDYARLLQKLRFLRHEVLVLHLLSAEERDFPYRGLVEFVGLEGDGPVEAEADFLRPAYREALVAWVVQMRRIAIDAGADSFAVDTSRPFAEALREVLSARARFR